ncbi:MAG: hypothetical protein OEU26_33975, partial [Candidatus Tectomicrobia bacterium]|nr:hypothetical protein [Candidatus Tectomicrobia bacterium]
MPLGDPLVWKAMVFSIAAIFLITFLTWWLYCSSLQPPVQVRPTPSPRLAGWFATLLAVSGLFLIIGGLWDGSMHIMTGEIPAGADFLWPPHLMIYGSFLLSFIVAEVALALIAVPSWRKGIRDPRRWVRSNPYLGAVALASMYTMAAIPGDALWHEIIGIDLTAWSPPHVLLGMMSAAVMASAVGLLVQSRTAMQRVGWANTAIMVLLVLMLKQMLLIGVSEWEWPVEMSSLQRPIWLYPLVGGGMAFFTLILGKHLMPYRWTATAIALLYYFMHLMTMLGLQLTDNIVPTFPLLFILGAFLLDVMPWQHLTSRYYRLLIPAIAFTTGYEILGLPLLTLRTHLAPFGAVDIVLAIVLMVATSLALMPAAKRT